MLQKCLPLLGALVLAAPASAVTINLSDFTFAQPATSTWTARGSPSYDGAAGAFSGGLSDGSAATGVASPRSCRAASADVVRRLVRRAHPDLQLRRRLRVHAWCRALPTSARRTATNLSRLFTAAQGFVVDNLTSAAMQAGIWEIIYEHGPSFSFTGGTFTGAPEQEAGQNAFNASTASS